MLLSLLEPVLIVQQKPLYNEIWLVLGCLIQIPYKYSADLRKITVLVVYVWPWLLERGLVLPITFIPKCLSNQVLMKLTVTLISEIISLDIFPFVEHGMIPVLHISHDIFSPAECASSQKVSSFVIPLYFRNVEGFVTVPHSQSWFVFKMIVTWKISRHWKEKLWLLKINSSMGAQVFQPCHLVHSSIVAIQLLVLLCSWRQLSTPNLPELKITNIAGHCSFLNSYTNTNT